jgi:hypothetical protein
MDEKQEKKNYILYKGKPLVRENNVFCYGNMSDKYILFLMVLSTKTINNSNITIEIPDKILIQILSTDVTKTLTERMEKQFERSGLYEALDIGIIWLDKLNNN